MSQSSPSVAVVILNYNGMKHQYLERFIPTVCQCSNFPNTTIYVADNGSTDDSVEHLLNEGFSVYTNSETELPADSKGFLLKMPENYGFAGGYNVALRQIHADYYVLLNSDVEVSADWIRPIIELMEKDPQIAACQPKVRMFAQKELFEHAGAAGGWVDKWGYPFCRGRIFGELEEDKGQYDDVTEVFWATGAAMFVRANLYHQLGGLDDNYFAHMEEIDLCWRLKRAGYKIMYCPKSVIFHVGGGTLPAENPRKDYLNFRNSLFTLLKNDERPFPVILARLLLDGIAGVRFLMGGKFKHIGAIIKAHWSFFGQLGTYRRKRRELKKIIANYQYPNSEPNLKGRYPKSIVWWHFVKKCKTFNDLPKN